MEENTITLTLGDWLYNAGVVGMVNILNHAKDEVIYNGQEVSFKVEALEKFEDKFFNYFIDKYEKKLSWSKIVSYKERIEHFENEDYKNFEEKSLELFNKDLDDIKTKIKSNSHKAAYDLINSDFSILDKEKELKKIKLKKKETIQDRIEEIKQTMGVLKEIIEYYSLEESKRYIAAKNVMYTIIKNAWNGVSILNPQTKEKNMYTDFGNYFPVEAKEYIDSNKEKHKFNCFTCDNPIANLNTEMNFLNATGFDTSRKPSHVWNFINDIAICPICKLVYSCVPAGFNYVYDKGIFVNDNHTVENIVNISKKIGTNILKDENMNANTTFKSIITALTEEANEGFKYEVADIQVVRYENEKYRFNILSKNILKVIRDSKEDLNKLIKASYKEVDTYFRVYEELVKKLFNNENQFLLIHKLFIHKLTKPKDSFFNYVTINRVIRINFNFLKGVGYMADKEKDVLKSYRGAGYYLRQEYKKKISENKLDGIAYKLLNALKTNNKGMFMDVVINCYLYANQQIPSFFTDCLKSNEELKTIGYAFVSGLVDGEEYKKEEKGGNN